MTSAQHRSAQLKEADFARHMVNHVREVFSTMVGINDLLHLPPVINPTTHFENSITAMVGLVGAYNGIVSLHAPRNLALNFTSGMLGVEVNDVDDDVYDALREITNMIAGGFKQHLSKGGLDIRLSTPSVITGNDCFFAVGRLDNALQLGFATNDGWFLVNAAFFSEKPTF